MVLGIGPNTAVYTLARAVFRNPLPVREAHELVAVHQSRQAPSGEYVGESPTSYANFLDYQQRTRSFAGLAAHAFQPVNLAGAEEPQRAMGLFVTAGYFELLGVRPHLGRFFAAGEDEPGRVAPAVVLGHRFWRLRLGGSSEVVGRSLQVNGRPLTVLGVAPEGFGGTALHVAADVWLPIGLYPEIAPGRQYFGLRGAGLFRMIGRLRPGTSLEAAADDAMAVARQLAAEHPKDNERLGTRLEPLLTAAVIPRLRESYRAHGRILAAAVSLVLLSACLNVSILLLAYGAQRREEMANRQAIGAHRRQLVRQLLVETLVLFSFGAALSLPFSRWFLDGLWSLRPPDFENSLLDLRLDLSVVSFAFGTALVAGLLVGVAPALASSRRSLAQALGSRSFAGRSSRRRWLPTLLLASFQVALALIALAGSGLFLTSLANARRLDLGFSARNLLAVTLPVGDQGYDGERTRLLLEEIEQGVAALPGVEAAALSENRLLRGAVTRWPLYREGQEEPLESDGQLVHGSNVVTPGFFAAAGIPLLQGRPFDARDCGQCPRVAVVNRRLAEAAWPAEDPLGKRFRLALAQPPFEVVGVVADTRFQSVTEPSRLLIYLPLSQHGVSSMTLHVRSAAPPETLAAGVRRAVLAVDAGLPLVEMDTMSRFVERSLSLESMAASLLRIFAYLAVALALLGLYSALTLRVSRQRGQLGLRIALGASRGRILASVLLQGCAALGLGILLGAALGAGVLLPAVRSQLHGVGSLPPTLLGLSAAVLGAVVLAASLPPALWATRTDPIDLLRVQ